MLSEIEQQLLILVRARYPYVYINTWEETRVERSVLEISCYLTKASKTDRSVYSWSLTQGLKLISGSSASHKAKMCQPQEVLNEIEKIQENAIFILKDFHPYLRTKDRSAGFEVVRRLRDVLPELRNGLYFKTVIFVSPMLVIPDEMQKEITVFDYPLPNEEEIHRLLMELIEYNGVPRVLTEQEYHELSQSALGMTEQEAKNAFSQAIVREHGISMKALETIFSEKKQVIRKSGILEFVDSSIDLDDIGGLDVLKKWLVKRNNSWSQQACAYQLPAPKGVLVTGIPGCGKSLTAKAMSKIWGLPLIQLDMGKIYSGLVGSSEENMRHAIQIAEAMAPCVLWIDEIEKGLSGSGSVNDAGTSTRVFGTLLTWMQEKTSMVFIIATANDISNLKPELLRKGRFDEIFFVDLPTQKEREAILSVHLRKRTVLAEIGLAEDAAFVSRVAKKMEGFVGSEIEAVVISALFEAFSAGRAVEETDFYQAIANTVPLSVTQADQIQMIREWARSRAVSATSTEFVQNQNECTNGRILY